MDKKDAIKNYIFNLGQMIVNLQPKEYLDSLGYSMKTAQVLAEVVFKEEIFTKVDRGEISLFEGVRIFAETFPDLADDVSKILTPQWFTVIQENQPFLKLLQTLKNEGNHLFIAAVFSLDGISYMRSHFNFFELFDDTVISSEIGSTDFAQLYGTLIERNHLRLDSTTAIDYNPKNLSVAKALGLRTVQYKDMEQLKMDI